MDYPPPKLQQSLGVFDLDPCAADCMPYKTAKRMVTKDEDGLKQDWSGKRVWLNPPYGREIGKFLARMFRGIALLPCRTDARWFHEFVAPRFDSILLIKGRIRFIDRNLKEGGSPAFASMLVAYTPKDTEAIQKSKIKGLLVKRI